jgi:Tol biopolymer transport system component
MTRRRPGPAATMALVGMALLTTVLIAQQKPATQQPPPASAATSPDALLGQALHEEDVEGRLQNAIAIYQRVLKAPGVTRAQAGRAQFRVGVCYERLGLGEARKAYEAVVADYADQAALAADARRRLASLGRSSGPPRPAGLTFRKVYVGEQAETPQVSPDGKYLTLVSPDTGDIVVQDLVTGTKRQVTHEGDPSRQGAYEAAVSPDGKQIAYVMEVWGGASDTSQSSCELRVTGFDGSNAHVLYTKKGGYIDLPGWSPDGKRLLVVLSQSENGSLVPAQVGWVAVADGSVRVIKTLPRRTQIPSTFRYPSLSVSSDGRWIAYSMLPGEESQEHDLFLMSADGSWDAPLLRHAADDRDPVWTPDGSRILFVSDRAGTTGIWSMAMADGKAAGPPEVVRANVGQIRGMTMTFARNGSCYYVLNAGMEDVHVAEIDPATGRVVTSPTQATARSAGQVRAPSWSPDGQYLAYFARTGRLANPDGEGGRLVIRSVRSGEEREVSTRIFQTAIPVRWFGDGRSVLLLGWAGERLGWVDAKSVRQVFYRLDTQTGDSRIVREFAPNTVGPPELSPDGKTIFYWQSEDPKTVRLVASNMETGLEKVIRRDGASDGLGRPAVSPDGRQLALFMPDAVTKSTAIRLMSVNGGDARELYRFPSPDDAPSPNEREMAWSPDGRYIFFVRASGKDGASGLWRVPAQGGEPQKIGLDDAHITSPSFHPDGRRLAFDVGVMNWTRLELWEMENFLPGRSAAR